MEDAPAPAFGKPVKIRQDVGDAGGEDKPFASDIGALLQGDLEAILHTFGTYGGSLQPFDRPVFHHLRAGFGGDFSRRAAILGQETVRCRGETVPPHSGVDNQHAPAGAGELKAGGKAGVAAAKDDYVMGHIGPLRLKIVSL